MIVLFTVEKSDSINISSHALQRSIAGIKGRITMRFAKHEYDPFQKIVTEQFGAKSVSTYFNYIGQQIMLINKLCEIPFERALLNTVLSVD